MELLDSEIEKADSEVERLGKEIGGHESDISGWATDKEDATTVRETERGHYMETHRDYQESIDAIDQAIIMLKNANKDTEAVSLLQKVSSFVKTPEETRKAIESFMEQQQEVSEPEGDLGYKATAYSFQSGAIIEMLEKLQGEFKTEITKLEKDEVAKRQTFKMLLQDIEDSTKDAKTAIEEKTGKKADHSKLSIEKSGDL